LRRRLCNRVTEHHGGLTPAALFRRAFVHRENRFLTGRRPHRNTRAGGVSPPWEHCTRAQRLKIAESRRWYKARPFAAPLIANATAIGTHHRRPCGQARLCLCKRVSQTHGGLTPAAPGRMCVCASQKSFSHRRTSASQYKSGGRKPPVVCFRNANPITAIRRIAVADAVCNPTAG
jgi:hypothetical protein